VHLEDICTAIDCALAAPADMINGEIFNVGNSDENYRVRDIAEVVAAEFPNCDIMTGKPSGDNRSYRVSFDKIHAQLPGFTTRWTARRGAAEMRELFERIRMSTETYEFRTFTRLRQLAYLQETGQLDNQLYWSRR